MKLTKYKDLTMANLQAIDCDSNSGTLFWYFLIDFLICVYHGELNVIVIIQSHYDRKKRLYLVGANTFKFLSTEIHLLKSLK